MFKLEAVEIRPQLLAVGTCPILVSVRDVAGGVEVEAKCAARNSKSALVAIAETDFHKVVILRWAYPTRDSISISGDAVLWAFSDRYGKELVAVLRRGGTFEMSISSYGGQGYPKKYRGVVHENGTVELVQLPSKEFLSIP